MRRGRLTRASSRSKQDKPVGLLGALFSMPTRRDAGRREHYMYTVPVDDLQEGSDFSDGDDSTDSDAVSWDQSDVDSDDSNVESYTRCNKRYRRHREHQQDLRVRRSSWQPPRLSSHRPKRHTKRKGVRSKGVRSPSLSSRRSRHHAASDSPQSRSIVDDQRSDRSASLSSASDRTNRTASFSSFSPTSSEFPANSAVKQLGFPLQYLTSQTPYQPYQLQFAATTLPNTYLQEPPPVLYGRYPLATTSQLATPSPHNTNCFQSSRPKEFQPQLTGQAGKDIDAIQKRINLKRQEIARDPINDKLHQELQTLQSRLNAALDAVMVPSKNAGTARMPTVPNTQRQEQHAVLQQPLFLENSGPSKGNAVQAGRERNDTSSTQRATFTQEPSGDEDDRYGSGRCDTLSHHCSGCGKTRSPAFHDLYPPVPDRESSPNYCMSCRKSRIRRGRLTAYHFCFGCGKVRSKDFQRAHPHSQGDPLVPNYCNRCEKHGEEMPSVTMKLFPLSNVGKDGTGSRDSLVKDSGPATPNSARNLPSVVGSRTKSQRQMTTRDVLSQDMSRTPTIADTASAEKAQERRLANNNSSSTHGCAATPYYRERSIGSAQRRAQRAPASSTAGEPTLRFEDEMAYRAPFVEEAVSNRNSGASMPCQSSSKPGLTADWNASNDENKTESQSMSSRKLQSQLGNNGPASILNCSSGSGSSDPSLMHSVSDVESPATSVQPHPCGDDSERRLEGFPIWSDSKSSRCSDHSRNHGPGTPDNLRGPAVGFGSSNTNPTFRGSRAAFASYYDDFPKEESARHRDKGTHSWRPFRGSAVNTKSEEGRARFDGFPRSPLSPSFHFEGDKYCFVQSESPCPSASAFMDGKEFSRANGTWDRWHLPATSSRGVFHNSSDTQDNPYYQSRKPHFPYASSCYGLDDDAFQCGQRWTGYGGDNVPFPDAEFVNAEPHIEGLTSAASSPIAHIFSNAPFSRFDFAPFNREIVDITDSSEATEEDEEPEIEEIFSDDDVKSSEQRKKTPESPLAMAD